MNLSALIQAGPAKANELFARLSETSEGAVKTRERLFAELKAQLELHTGLEEQHLFPLLRRNTETKDIVAEAIKDNKELRAKLAELEALPKNDPAFADRLKQLQKSFRQHARDEKRELLPAVQRALSEQQVQRVAEKIEAGAVEAGQARQNELEERRARARQEREQAERHAASEQARKVKAEQAHHEEEAQHQAKLQAAHEEAERRATHESRQLTNGAQRSAVKAAETIAQTAAAAPTNVLQIPQRTSSTTQHIGTEVKDMAGASVNEIRPTVPDARAKAALPAVASGAMTEMRSAWMSRMGKATLASVEMYQDLLQQAAARQRQLVTDAVQACMERNARIMDIATRSAWDGFRPLMKRTPPEAKQRAPEHG